MRFTSLGCAFAFSAYLLQGCAVQAPPAPIPPAPHADCQAKFDDAKFDAISKRHRRLMQALNAGQVDQALALYAPDAIVVAPRSEPSSYKGPTWVRLYLQEHLVAKGARFDTSDLFEGWADHCEVQVRGGQYLLSLDGEQRPRPYLIVWRRINAEWSVIAHHVDLASRLPQPAARAAAP